MLVFENGALCGNNVTRVPNLRDFVYKTTTVSTNVTSKKVFFFQSMYHIVLYTTFPSTACSYIPRYRLIIRVTVLRPYGT